MAAVNFERAWLHLKAHIDTKSSHSKRELFEKMAQLEVESAVPPELEGFDRTPMPGRKHEQVPEHVSQSNGTPAEASA